MKQSLLMRDDRFKTCFNEIKAPPNNKQFAIAQYLFASISKNPRQLCHLPPGQGKSRVAATTALMYLLYAPNGKVRFVFPEDFLVDRDKNLFSDIWSYFEKQNMVTYHSKLDF